MNPEEWQEWQRSLGVPIVRGASMIGVPMSEVVEFVANERGRGRRLLAISPLPTDPADYAPPDAPVEREEDPPRRPWFPPQMQLVFGEPDQGPELMDPATVRFTPNDAIAVVKERRSHGRRLRTVGPITEIRAALMTLAEVEALVDHGIPPGRPGTVPGGLVVLVLIRGAFEMYPPFPNSTPISHTFAYQVHNSRTGGVFQSGSGSRDVVFSQATQDWWSVYTPPSDQPTDGAG
jgi:hypothetical protein